MTRFVLCLLFGIQAFAQEESLGEQLRDAIAHGRAKLSLFAHEEDVADEEDVLGELLISQELELEFNPRWSLESELEHRADNRHFTAGILDEPVEEQARRYHLNLREAYLHFAGTSTDLYLGKKIYAWGKADGFNPADNLNPYDYLDFLTAEKIGILSAAFSYTTGTSGLDLVWVPRFTPARVPGPESRWFPPPDLPLGTDPSQLQLGRRQLPDNDLGNSQGGLRLWATRAGFDVAVTAYRGYDPIPAVGIALDLETGGLVASPVFNETTELGLSVARVFGSTALHFEGAYRDTEQDYDDDFFSYVIGLNRSFYVGGAIQEVRLIAEYVDEAFITHEENDRRFTTGLSRPFRDTVLMEWTFVFNEDTELKLAGAYNLEEEDFFVQPRFLYSITDTWKMELGLDLIDGDPGTFWGNWARNDRAFAHLEWFF